MRAGMPGFEDGGYVLPTAQTSKDTYVSPWANLFKPTYQLAPTPTQPAPAPVTQPVATSGLSTAPTAGSTTTGTTTPSTSSPASSTGSSVSQPAPAPVQTTQQAPAPPAASGLPATTTGTAVTPPPDQSLLDEVRRQREATILMGGPDFMDIRFGGMSPLFQQTFAENRAQRYGIPAEEVLYAAQRGRRELGGVANSGLGVLNY